MHYCCRAVRMSSPELVNLLAAAAASFFVSCQGTTPYHEAVLMGAKGGSMLLEMQQNEGMVGGWGLS